MTTIHSGDIDCPIAPFLSISSARLRSLILKKHLTTINAQLRTEKKADPHLTQNIYLRFLLTSTDATNSTRQLSSSNSTSSTSNRSAPIFNFIAAQQLPTFIHLLTLLLPSSHRPSSPTCSAEDDR